VSRPYRKPSLAIELSKQGFNAAQISQLMPILQPPKRKADNAESRHRSRLFAATYKHLTVQLGWSPAKAFLRAFVVMCETPILDKTKLYQATRGNQHFKKLDKKFLERAIYNKRLAGIDLRGYFSCPQRTREKD
jgi:hypothetical protein